MWNTWLECRNQKFHFFPGKESLLPFDQVEKHLVMLLETMDQAVDCQPELIKNAKHK
jgi:hypothetical protein